MRYLLVIGEPSPELQTALGLFEDKGTFICTTLLGRITNWTEILQTPPELILLHLDQNPEHIQNLIKEISKRIGILPRYIGFTKCFKKGFEAFKQGCVDIILNNYTIGEMLQLLEKYEETHNPKRIHCIGRIDELHYMDLQEVLLLKADNYTCEFILRDGSVIYDFKNLKNTHRLLPNNFQRIHRSWVINAHYVQRIHMSRRKIYLRHFREPLPYTVKYKDSIERIKKILSEA